MGGVEEVPEPPRGRQDMEEGESGASNKIRTTITEMGLGEDKMDEGGVKEAEGDEA